MREYPRPLLLSKIHTRPQGTWGEGLGEIRHIREVLEEIVGGERVRCEGVEEGEGGGELQGESEREGKEREASQTFPYIFLIASFSSSFMYEHCSLEESLVCFCR